MLNWDFQAVCVTKRQSESFFCPFFLADTPVTAKVGDEVVLAPGSSSVTGPITTIVWKHGESLAMEWDGNEVEAFRHFKGVLTGGWLRCDYV